MSRIFHAAGFSVFLLCAYGAQAATITVNTLDDELNIDGDCSLREAIQASNDNAAVDACPAGTPGTTGPDTILFASPLEGETIVLDLDGFDFEDNNADGDLDVLDGNLIISGPGPAADSIIIDGNGDSTDTDTQRHRVLHVPLTSQFFTRLELQNLTIQNGRLERNDPANGGGVSVEPAVGCTAQTGTEAPPCFAMRNVAIVNNIVTSTNEIGTGGGLEVNLVVENTNPGRVIIENSRIANNTAISQTVDANAGGVSLLFGNGEVPGPLITADIRFSSIENNNVSVTGAGGEDATGGGLSVEAFSQPVELRIMDTDIIGNAVSGPFQALGGGVYTDLRADNGSLVIIERAQFIGNNASVANAGSNARIEGGGLMLFGDGVDSARIGPEVRFVNNRLGDDADSTDVIAAGAGASIAVASTAARPIVDIFKSEFSNNIVSIRSNRHAIGGGIAASAGETTNGNTTVFSIMGCPGPGACIGLRNSTISGNTVSVPNGNSGAGGVAFVNDTIAGINNATIANNGVAGNQTAAGGLGAVDGASVQLRHAIVANNQAGAANSDDCASFAAAGGPGGGSIDSGGFNLIGDTTGCNFNSVASDQTGDSNAPIDPLLEPLADIQGALTRAHLLQEGSPAIDTGSQDNAEVATDGCELDDQIGTIRPQDGDGDNEAVCDIGAIESAQANQNEPPIIVAPIQDQTLSVNDQPITIDLNTVFADPEEGPLFFSANAIDPGVVTTSIDDETGILSITPAGQGVSDVDVTAFDEFEASITDTAEFTVVSAQGNQPPSIVSEIPDQTLSTDGGDFILDLTTVFMDPEGDPLVFSATSSDPSVVRAMIEGNELRLTPVSPGTATITVAAEDQFGANRVFRVASAADGPGSDLSGGGGGCVLAQDGRSPDPMLWLLIGLALAWRLFRLPGMAARGRPRA